MQMALAHPSRVLLLSSRSGGPQMSKGLRRSRAVPSRSQMSSMSARNASGTCLPTATVEVDLGERSYPIYIGSGLLDSGKLLRQHIPGVTALVVTNDTIAPHYLCLLYTSPSPRDATLSRMPSSA